MCQKKGLGPRTMRKTLLCFSSCRLAENSTAANTQNYCFCVAKDGGDLIDYT